MDESAEEKKPIQGLARFMCEICRTSKVANGVIEWGHDCGNCDEHKNNCDVHDCLRMARVVAAKAIMGMYQRGPSECGMQIIFEQGSLGY